MYQGIANIANKLFTKAQTFKYGFNLSPMYRRSTARIKYVSEDLLVVKIKIRRSWRNKNYVGSIFGGSLFSATDPIYMIQLYQILGKNYVVWDKSTQIRFKRPAYTTMYAEFIFTSVEITEIKNKIALNQEIDYIKLLNIVDEKGDIYCTLEKTIYVASKSFYKDKLKRRNENKS